MIDWQERSSTMIVILIVTVLFFIVLSFTPLLVASEHDAQTSVFLHR